MQKNYSHMWRSILTTRVMLTNTMAEAVAVINRKSVADFEILTFMVM